MERSKVLLYINCTNKEEVDKKAFQILEGYCERKGYDPVMSFGEDTELTGMSNPVKFMCVGLGTTLTIDKVITINSAMIGNTTNSILDVLGMLEEQEVYVETVADDMDMFYDMLYGNIKVCGTDCEEESAFVEFLSNIFTNK